MTGRDIPTPSALELDEIAPVPVAAAARALARCVIRTVGMIVRGELGQPDAHTSTFLTFADGTTSRVYRETVARRAATDEPTLLVVCFRLRWVRGRGHALFRAESLLNTPLFAGFPGFVSKLWVTADERGVYRGVYQWNGAEPAQAYVRALWWVLALVSERASIHAAIVPGVRRDEVLADPAGAVTATGAAWWRITHVR